MIGEHDEWPAARQLLGERAADSQAAPVTIATAPSKMRSPAGAISAQSDRVERRYAAERPRVAIIALSFLRAGS